MTEPEGMPIPQSIHDAAEKWLVSHAGHSDPAAERAFTTWLEADPRHRIAYDRIKRDWQLGTLLGERPVGQTRSLGRAPFWMRQKTHIAAAGLGAAVLLGVVTVSLVRPGRPLAISMTAQAAIYETGVGEIRTVGLSDGSTVILDTATRLRVQLSGGDRRLDLERGRARFRVAADSKRPFRVQVAGGEIIAHGTMFDVNMIGEKPVVTVLDGSVDLRGLDGASDQARTLPMGKSMTLDASMAERVASPAEARWVSGMLALDGTPLAEAVAAINRYNKVQVRLAEPFALPVRVTGGFRVRDPEAFARAVATSFHLKVERPDSDTILLVAPAK
ncbi:FecR domain-containing protein [Sphingobium sp. EM0848]|uniref:FecR family protein n=1 Tax=Sphingobium sp. EM0848 TaxID=2743473 RepID=UPI00159C8BD3|nr:FecR domain-containing protein [Sphingobium sp. EM0848]